MQVHQTPHLVVNMDKLRTSKEIIVEAVEKAGFKGDKDYTFWKQGKR